MVLWKRRAVTRWRRRGFLAGIFYFDSFQNIGDLETTGLDFDLGYKLASDVGDFKFGFVMNYVLKFEEYRPGLNDQRRLNLEAGDFEQPEIRHTTSVDWSLNDVSATVALNYIGEFGGDADSGFADKTEPPLKPNQPNQRIKTPAVANGILCPGIA